MLSVIADNFKGEDAFTLGQLSPFMPNALKSVVFMVYIYTKAHKPFSFRFCKTMVGHVYF